MIKVRYIFFLAALTVLSDALSGQFAENIADCPPLTPRITPPTSVHDLRPDDIKVVGALGDSVMAGFAAIDTPIGDIGDIEYRGVSYAIGGDEGAKTIPNYLKHYQPKLAGYSFGKHKVEICLINHCDEPYNPNLDALNSAQSGATAMYLDRQITYLIDRMRSMENVDFEKDWKMITIQIGSNDMCQSCSVGFQDITSTENFERSIESALERIQADIPRVLVNLFDAFNVTYLFEVDGAQNRCKGSTSPSMELGCPCSADKDKGWKRMSDLNLAFNEKLENIFQKYQKKRSNDFAVVRRRFSLDYKTAPDVFYSNYDCFHPSLIGHEFSGKIIWNQLFSPQIEQLSTYNFSYRVPLYCPTDNDRLITY